MLSKIEKIEMYVELEESNLKFAQEKLDKMCDYAVSNMEEQINKIGKRRLYSTDVKNTTSTMTDLEHARHEVEMHINTLANMKQMLKLTKEILE